MNFLFVLFLSVLCLFFLFGALLTLCFILSQFSALRRTVKRLEVLIIRYRLFFFAIGLSIFMIVNYFAIEEMDTLVRESYKKPRDPAQY